MQKTFSTFFKGIVLLICFVILLKNMSIAQSYKTEDFELIPIEHASFVIKTDTTIIFVDPVGNSFLYRNFRPDIILITDIHGDHFNKLVLDSLTRNSAKLIGPKVITDVLRYGITLNNNEDTTLNGINILALPMYNISPGKLKYHEKGRGNGYLLTIKGKRIYVSGDSEDTPEMRTLNNIDLALVCMNLPFTMDVKSAASAVIAFKPKVVIPYHYRGKEGFSDVNKFAEIVAADSNIHVELLEWYH